MNRIKRSRQGKYNSNGNFDRRYATGNGRTSAQKTADRRRVRNSSRRKRKYL